MRRAGRVRHQGLGAAETHRKLDHLQRIEQAKCLRLSALDGEAESRARALALPLEHRLPRIVGGEKAEIIDAAIFGCLRRKFATSAAFSADLCMRSDSVSIERMIIHAVFGSS